MNGIPLDVEFEEQESGAGFRGDVPTKHTFEQNYDNYFETFVREVLQNANDAGLDNDDPVKVEFRFEVLSGTELTNFKEAINWSDLLTHFEAAKGEDHILRLEEYLSNLEATEEMVVLVVEDYNTSGLSGEEDERSGESTYTSLVRDWQVTYKQNSSAGGSHGVGKSVLWASSGISTVFFNSVPANSNDHDSPRLVGRSILPDHYLDDTHHHGKSWIGRRNQDTEIDRPVSLWGDEAEDIAAEIGLNRPTEKPGTSILIPGFCSPTGNIKPSSFDMVPEFVRAAARSFWPAIHQEQLEVFVEREDGKRYQITKESLDQVPEVAPFVQCYEERQNPVKEIKEPGDVGVTSLPVEFKRRNDKKKFNGEVTLCARLQDPGDRLSGDEKEYDLTNHTAVFRGAGMVVDYVSKSEPAVYGDDYYGVLIAGEARLWNETKGVDIDEETEEAVDEFLTASEPASHDSWGSTPMLQKKYMRGCVSTARSLQGSKLNRGLVDLVRRDRDHSGRFVSSVAEHLPDLEQMQTDAPTRKKSDDDDDDDDDDDTSASLQSTWTWDFEDSQWCFEGSVKPSDDPDGDWGVEILIPKRGEDGATAGYEDVAEFDSPTDGVEDETKTVEKNDREIEIGSVTASPDVKSFEFECRSEPLASLDPFSGSGGRTSLSIQRADPGGDD